MQYLKNINMAAGGKRNLSAFVGGDAQRDPSDAIPDKETLQKAVLRWCTKKKAPSVPSEKEAEKFIKLHWEACLAYIEDKLKCEEVGLGLCKPFIRLVIKEYMMCDYVTVDVDKPEPCKGCGKEEVTLKDDGSNANECIWMCDGVQQAKENKELIVMCQAPYCTTCSKQKEGWDYKEHPFFCPSCNNETSIAESERLLSLQKEEPLVPQDGPKEQTKKLRNKTEWEPYKFLTSEISQKTVREMCGLKAGVVPTKADYRRCAMVYQDEHGIPKIVKFKTAKPVPERIVHIRILDEYKRMPKFYKAWHNIKVHVKDVLERIKKLLIDAKNMKKEVQPILQKLIAEEEAFKELPKDQKKKKEQKAPVKYKELEDMKDKLERARELSRAAAKQLNTSELQFVEQQLQKFYDFFQCAEIPDSDCSDDSGPEDENQNILMEDNT